MVVCHTSTRISHRYTHVAFLLNLPPISLPIAPFWIVTEPLFESPESHRKFSYTDLCHYHFGAVYWSYLRCCLPGCGVHFALNKTELNSHIMHLFSWHTLGQSLMLSDWEFSKLRKLNIQSQRGMVMIWKITPIKHRAGSWHMILAERTWAVFSRKAGKKGENIRMKLRDSVLGGQEP